MTCKVHQLGASTISRHHEPSQRSGPCSRNTRRGYGKQCSSWDTVGTQALLAAEEAGDDASVNSLLRTLQSFVHSADSCLNVEAVLEAVELACERRADRSEFRRFFRQGFRKQY